MSLEKVCNNFICQKNLFENPSFLMLVLDINYFNKKDVKRLANDAYLY